MGDFSKRGVHKTDEFWWVIFQRGEYTKPMAFHEWFFQRGEYTKPMSFDEWFFKGGSTQNRWLFGNFSEKIKRPGRLFRQIRCLEKETRDNLFLVLQQNWGRTVSGRRRGRSAGAAVYPRRPHRQDLRLHLESQRAVDHLLRLGGQHHASLANGELSARSLS